MLISTAELAAIESYYDTVPRASARAEELVGFTLFVSTGGFPFYARPTLGRVRRPTVADVTAVRVRQRQLGVPEAFEWVDELQPELAGAIRAAGLVVFRLPLMVHRDAAAVPPPTGIRLRVLAADDGALPQVQAAIGLGFTSPGTGVGIVGDAQRASAEQLAADVHQHLRDRITAGAHVLVGAFGAAGAVAGGSHSPRDEVTEITGVATLPAYRRRGIGAAVTAALVADAGGRGARTCFLSAGSSEVARVYARAGFERVGTACIAGAPAG